MSGIANHASLSVSRLVSTYCVFGTLVLLFVLACAAFLATGPRPVSMETAIGAFTAFDPDNFDHQAIFRFRMPRLLAAIVVGAALALSGAMMQALVRNPLAEPQLLGLNSGAALAVVLVSVMQLPAVGLERPGIAALGALAAFALTFGLAALGRSGATPLKITLCGVIVSAFLSALTSALLLLDEQSIEDLRLWLSGDLGGQSYQRLLAVVPLAGIGTGTALLIAPKLDLLSLGDDVARGLGVSLFRTRFLTMISAAILCGCAVSLAGPIGFIGLIVPHLLRRFLSNSIRTQFLASLLAGPCLLVLADIAARSLISPAEISTGVVTGAAGAVVFITVVVRYFK